MKAAIYIRKSRKDKDKPSHRLEVQREQLPSCARSHGWEFEIYDDGHASAARGKIEDLKQRGRLERDIRAGKIHAILTIELSRLSRDESLQDYVAWLHLCSEHGVKLATLSRILDPSQHSDWMLLLMEGGFSSVEMKVLKARMKEGHDQAFKKGQFLGGRVPPPYVYDHANSRPVIDPSQLPRMQRIWALAETMSTMAVAKETGEQLIFVRRALADERLLWYQALRLDPETGETITCAWEPCLDAEQAARISAARKRRTNGQVRRPYASLLSGLDILRCGYCGRTAKTWQDSKVRKDGSRNSYYGCQSQNEKRKCTRARLIPQFLLDEKVITNLCHVLENMQELKGYWLAAQEKNDPSKELALLNIEEGKEAARKQRIVAAIGEGILEFSDAKQQMQTVNNTLATLQARRAELVAMASRGPDWDALAISREQFETMTVEERREIIAGAIDKIRIHENYAIIVYAFPVSPNGCEVRLQFPQKQDGYIRRK
jgi:DNA invertase Pin-like site-specific DNA recombinase